MHVSVSNIKLDQKEFEFPYAIISNLEDSEFSLLDLRLTYCKLIGTLGNQKLPSEFIITFLKGISDVEHVYKLYHPKLLVIYYNSGNPQAPILNQNPEIIGTFYLSPVFFSNEERPIEEFIAVPQEFISRLDKLEKDQREQIKLLQELKTGQAELRTGQAELRTVQAELQELRTGQAEQRKMLIMILHSIANLNQKSPESLKSDILGFPKQVEETKSVLYLIVDNTTPKSITYHF